MKIGLLLGGLFTSCQKMVEIAKRSEEGGVDCVYVADSQMIYRSCFVTLGLIASQTRAIHLGSCVSPISTRDPTVLANEALTVNELSNGRVILGLGAGDSGVLRVGKKRSRLSELEEMVRIMRSLLQDGSLVSGALRIRWLSGNPRIPIFLSATGPKTLGLAGKIADGVMILVGAFRESIEYAIGQIQEGAKQAGRDINDIKLAPIVYVYPSTNASAAFELGKPDVVWFYRNAPYLIKLAGGKPIDMSEMPYERFDFVHSDARSMAETAPSFVEDEVTRKIIIAGTPAEVVERIKNLERLGINQVIVRHTENEKGWMEFFNIFLDEIVPSLR